MVEEVLRAPHVLEYTYHRSVGPVVGAFLTGLRDGKVLGIKGSEGRVIVPPTEYDPLTGESTGEFAEVGPTATVQSWAWSYEPYPDQPLAHPFAWALVRFEGADTALLHVVDAGSPDAMQSGMTVTPRWRERAERQGHIKDIECFVPA